MKNYYQSKLPEAGCDEAGRGALAGPVYAAAVIFPNNINNPLINDSKKLSPTQREDLRLYIEENALAYHVASVSNKMIDAINILNASILAMHKAIDNLSLKPEFLIIDGNKFRAYKTINHQTIVKGDSAYISIAAASILAKTYRDKKMEVLHKEFPDYNWIQNKGYGTLQHRRAIINLGYCKYHRNSFRLKELRVK